VAPQDYLSRQKKISFVGAFFIPPIKGTNGLNAEIGVKNKEVIHHE
jgi:hypothetical protein